MQALDSAVEDETQDEDGRMEDDSLEDDLMKAVCSKCKSIFDNWYERDNWSSARPGHTHHSIVGLQLSTQAGCPVCALLLSQLDHDAVQELLQKRPHFRGLVTVEVDLAGLQCGYSLELLFYDKGDPLPNQLKESWKTGVEAFPSVSRNLGKVQDVVDCEENWALVKKWLRVCQDTHTKCSQNSIDRELPTRLIYVGVNNQDLNLCHSSSLPRETQYLTLSHCWGGKVFTILTRDNFQKFLSHIPVDSLSKTFRDAIVTTRSLGFKYLWIDSLCIIQGDEVDWREEASRMGTVYANSALNIAASGASNGDIGCFLARDPGQVYGCQVATHMRQDPSHATLWDCTIRSFAWRIIHENVLSSRAWVYQEYLLAPRTLHFTVHQLFWECTSSEACETFPGSHFHGALTRPGVKISWNNLHRDITKEWGHVVSGYSIGAVTFSKDKLIALSGVARLFADIFGTSYLAGIWKEDLVRQLTWTAEQPSGLDTKSSIPSWSWASIRTPVSYIDNVPLKPDCNELVQILEATTVPVDDYFGDVNGGTIRMRCHLPCIAAITEAHNDSVFTIRFGSRHFVSALFHDTVPYNIGDELYLVALLRGSSFGVKVICGLIIEPTQQNSYRRTGFFKLYNDDDDNDLDRFMEAQDEATSDNKYFVGEALGSNEDGHEMCIITLV